jgi:hypothetical protein
MSDGVGDRSISKDRRAVEYRGRRPDEWPATPPLAPITPQPPIPPPHRPVEVDIPKKNPPTSFVSPKDTKETGSVIHALVLRIIYLRLWAIGIPNEFEIPTPGGSKKISSDYPGRVDLSIFLPASKKPGTWEAHLYELKPFSPHRYKDYVSEVNHYTDYFPPQVTVRGVVYRISRARIGETLAYVERNFPQVFAPITLRTPFIEIFLRFFIAKDGKGDPLDGVIYYVLGWRQPPPQGEEQSNIERAVEMLKVRARKTAAAQAHGQVRIAAVAGALIVIVSAAFEFLAILGVEVLLPVAALAPAAAATPIIISLETLPAGKIANEIFALAAGIVLALRTNVKKKKEQ